MKNKVCSVAFLVIAMLSSIKTQAQYTQDIIGRPFSVKAYADVTGSPYLYDGWQTGIVKLQNGDTFKDIPLLYNAIDNELYFKSKKGDTLSFVDKVAEFQISTDSKENAAKVTFRRGYKGVKNYTADTFFEVLSDGTVQLLKKTAKYVQSTKDVGSATVNKTVRQDINYYLVNMDRVVSIRKDKKSILTNLPGGEQKLQSYLAANKVNFKDDADLIKLVNQYNSL